MNSPKTSLSTKVRRWHAWGGLLAGLVLLSSSFTGLVLSYKQPIFSALGIEGQAKAGRRESGGASGAPMRGAVAGAELEAAMEIAMDEWGDAPLERIELRAERGGVACRLRQAGGKELWVAADGSHYVKNEYERVGKDGTRTRDWGRLLLDLHTGKLGGETGKAVVACAALVLTFLTLSGLYLWCKPLWSRSRLQGTDN